MNRVGTPMAWMLGLVLLAGCTAAGNTQSTGHEPVVGGPCEGCEAVFQGLPESIPAAARIAPPDEPGEPMRIEGEVRRPDGTAAAATVIYAYHTDAKGHYPPDDAFRGQAAYRHGRLRGWARTDREGRYRFDTIRPGGYPNSHTPQHVHMHVIEPGRCTYYIDSIVFSDDPRLTREQEKQYHHGRGGSAIAVPRRDEDGVWVVERDIVLGERIPGYPAIASPVDPTAETRRR